MSLCCFPGEFQVIGSTRPIAAMVGDDVTLPCHLEPGLDVRRLTVEWTRADLPPDPRDKLNRRKYVHLYRHGQEDALMKNVRYSGRTLLSRRGLVRGDMALKLTNVTLQDAGKYQCFIPKLKNRVKEALVQLVVVEPLPPTPAEKITTVNPDEKEKPDGKGEVSRPTAWIVAVIVTVVLSLTGLSLCVVCCQRTRKQEKQPDYESVTQPIIKVQFKPAAPHPQVSRCTDMKELSWCHKHADGLNDAVVS
uniref:Ig-like domain-containing protein n=1 Tax=Myripristis murdjan TaxID=586833 RepID=A0A667ZMK4_9TELE